MADEITQIYDKVFKRILTLSPPAVINFINGIFSKDLPPDGEIQYNWTENVNDKLEKTLSDTIITINETEKLHMEAQISKDDAIVLRMFDYGYQDAIKYKKISLYEINLKFPEPKIIYLEHNSNTPDKVVLVLDFGKQGNFEYKVGTIKVLNYCISELSEKKMILLLPLYLLKLRKAIMKKQSKENAQALKALINDIIRTLDQSEQASIITHNDTIVLINLLRLLYNHLYSDINEFKKEGVADMLEERLMTYTEAAVEEALLAERKKTEQEKKEAELKIKKIIMNCFKKGMDLEEIADLTGFQSEQIIELKEGSWQYD